MFNKVLVGAMLAGSLVLAGCSSDGANLTKLDADVQVLSQKVEVLQGDVNVLKHETKAVSDEAARANQRLDNQATAYRK